MVERGRSPLRHFPLITQKNTFFPLTDMLVKKEIWSRAKSATLMAEPPLTISLF